ncbi:hypothetical protein DYB36_009491 [Aphanomyces astaci]|uniref:Uncharacterized protein n=1 Tax=Aphanomyces astaci TaxID=112090 RepID=A0A396ZU33_APHAT|nr:hypothetical protein DYB36_009491 [Aphanomyces astaci]
MPQSKEDAAGMDDTLLGIHDDMETHPLYRNLAHIKTKKVKELEFYKRYAYTLQRQVWQGRQQQRRRKSSLLPWEEVARALQDDTLDRVRDNRRLEQQVEANKRLCSVLKPWVRHMAMLESPSKPPNSFQSCWRHAHLFRGDDAMRRIGSRWLLQHMYYNMDHAMEEAPFPNLTDPFLDISRSDLSTGTCLWHPSLPLGSSGRQTMDFELLVTQQFVVEFPLAMTADGVWAANRTFAQFVLKQDFATNYHDLTPKGMEDSSDVEYAQEEVGTATQRVSLNWIQGRFYEPHRTAILVKTIVDDAFPLAENAWTMCFHHWIVLYQLTDSTTLVRVQYTVHQPASANGFVPLSQVAQYRRVGMGTTDDVAARLVVERDIRSHTQQRQLFPIHLNNVLHSLTKHNLETTGSSVEMGR